MAVVAFAQAELMLLAVPINMRVEGSDARGANGAKGIAVFILPAVCVFCWF